MRSFGGPYVDARLGDFATARAKLERSKEICRDLGIAYGLAEAHMAGAKLEMLAGELHAAERELRAAIDLAAAMEAEHYVALYRVRLARVLNEQGRHDEAGVLLADAATLSKERASWQSNWARVLAARGETDAAVALAREAEACQCRQRRPDRRGGDAGRRVRGAARSRQPSVEALYDRGDRAARTEGQHCLGTQVPRAPRGSDLRLAARYLVSRSRSFQNNVISVGGRSAFAGGGNAGLVEEARKITTRLSAGKTESRDDRRGPDRHHQEHDMTRRQDRRRPMQSRNLTTA